ncbi:hypothetical protein ACEPAF_5472 [Sanghuangporus sanghuang]
MFLLYDNVLSNTKSVEERVNVQSEWTDVRDMAEAQLKVLRTPEAGGQRCIIASEPFTWLGWCCGTVNGLKLPGINAPSSTEYKGLLYKLQTAKDDIIDDFKERGFLK